MSVLNQIASLMGRRDEVPNQELARALANKRDRQGIREIAENLWNKDAAIRSDCLKVLYEIGYLDPALIADYAGDFVRLLKDKNNRLVWGAMIALGTIAALKSDELYPHREEIEKTMEKGSVITVDNGVKTLAGIASGKESYRREIFPYLLHHLQTCRPKDVPQHAEKIVVAVDGHNKGEFAQTLEKRLDDLTDTQVSRVKKVIRVAQKLPE